VEDWDWLEQHLKNSSGQGCPAIYEAGRARIFAEAQHFLAGEMQAVLQETSPSLHWPHWPLLLDITDKIC